MDDHSTRRPAYLRITGGLIIIVLAGSLFEGGARTAFHMKDAIRARVDLHDYQMLDPRDHNLWRLRPGYSETLQQALPALQVSGRALGVQYLRDEAVKLHAHPDDLVFRINEDGFKGPELNQGHSRLGILELGDSCTFWGRVR